MNNFEKHLLESKTKFIRLFREDLKKDFGVDVPEGYGFTQSDFFYFGALGEFKYVHKEAMRFILTNGDTYQEHEPLNGEFPFEADQERKEVVNNKIEVLFNFFRSEINQHPLYPEFTRESESFLVFKYYRPEAGWGRINSLSRVDARHIKENYKPLESRSDTFATPLYNQMADKVFKHKESGEIKFVDLKSFELRPKAKPMIYFYNGVINDLYVLGLNISPRKKLIRRFELDYPVMDARIKRYFF